MELTSEQRAELAALVNSADVSASVATRARIVLWRAKGRPKVEIAALAGVSVNGQFVLPAGGQEFSPLVASCFSPTTAR